MIKKHELLAPDSCLNKAGENEMVFVLRAKDAAAPFVIREWVRERIRLGLNKTGDEKMADALGCARTMEVQKDEMGK